MSNESHGGKEDSRISPSHQTPYTDDSMLKYFFQISEPNIF